MCPYGTFFVLSSYGIIRTIYINLHATLNDVVFFLISFIMGRSKASNKHMKANERRMRLEGVVGGNKRTSIDIGYPFKGKAPYYVSNILATHLM